MNLLKTFAFAAIIAAFFALTPATPKAQPQPQVSVNIGVAPECPYGYYDYAPYDCAPYGYYGSEWFTGGVFIGAGPWFHGSTDFHGTVDNRFDPNHGYKGVHPARGEKPEPDKHLDNVANFKGNEQRDGRGHAVGDRH
jgi:hypothetical protein